MGGGQDCRYYKGMWTTIIILSIIVAGIVLFKVYETSEEEAAEPLEEPTKEDLAEANLSTDLPVADQGDNQGR